MSALKLIKVNSTGPEVGRWQYFLRGRGFYLGEVTEKFDEETLRATIEFQRRFNLQPDGIVGNKTYGVAMQLGFEGIEDESTEKTSMNWPGAPPFAPLISNEQRRKVFGTFTFVSEPMAGNPENIRITGGWQAKKYRDDGNTSTGKSKRQWQGLVSQAGYRTIHEIMERLGGSRPLTPGAYLGRIFCTKICKRKQEDIEQSCLWFCIRHQRGMERFGSYTTSCGTKRICERISGDSL